MTKDQSSYDVVVIGGGIAGVSLAAELSSQVKVLLLEREKNPGMHSTGRSAAYYAPSYGNDVVRQLTRDSETYFRSSEHEVSLIRDRAALFIGMESQSKSLDQMLLEQPNLKRLSGTEATKIVTPLKREQISGGILDTVGGDLDVDAILQGYLKSFRSRGGDLKSSSEVQSLSYADGLWHVKGLSLDVKTPIVINAAGAWADVVAKMAGLGAVGLEPKRRTAVLVDGEASWAEWPLTIDIDEQFYFKPDAGQLLISPADETPSEPCDAQPDELDIAIAIDRVQQIADIPVRKVNHKWAGLRTFAPDKTFVIGFDPRATGFFWCAGQGGYGVQSAPGVAKFVGQLCLGGSLDDSFAPLITQVAPDRFC
jgi:D-arginine dehydrogenase